MSDQQSGLEPLMTIDEVSEFLRVPVITIKWLRQEGRFAPAVKIGRRLSWQRSAVLAWVAEQQEQEVAA
ncbi:helix-turn-helix domain-containing protein [Nocardioides sp. NBC_00850]|uniref:helix-turn-helix transcriptional regulator n=1 Tax=Nocardioides sp. NBC_00850 TaxID=2976001 RepID=UPI00386AE518|nr:helix-turn-helix domain-containing protein [Nocardioides sp. NBC_00850]